MSASAPRYGWCATRHNPRKAAQSGYFNQKGEGCCKKCFAEEGFPHKAAAKRAALRQACDDCGEVVGLIQGRCGRCTTARAASEARSCQLCHTANATSVRLATCHQDECSRLVVACAECERAHPHGTVFCRSCWASNGSLCICCGCTPARPCKEFGYVYCKACYTTCFGESCQFCQADLPTAVSESLTRCCRSGCDRPVRLCPDCAKTRRRTSTACATCWSDEGGQCIVCRRVKAQKYAEFKHVYCKDCFSTNFQEDCEFCHDALRRKADTHLEDCRQIVTNNGREEECQRRSRLCDLCSVSRYRGETPVACHKCWSSAGRLCLSCGETPAQKQKQYKSR